MSLKWWFGTTRAPTPLEDERAYMRQFKYLADGTYAEAVYVLVNHGPVTDASYDSPPPIGALAVDITNGFLYVRTGPNLWLKVAVG